MNTLACMLLDSISELSYDDADFVIDVVEQYLSQIPGDEENKRRIVRRYASLIVADIRKQIYEHMDRKTQDVHIIQKDLILFRKFVKNVKEDGKVKYDKPFSDKSNIKKYLFTGYKKSYYPANAFDSDTGASVLYHFGGRPGCYPLDQAARSISLAYSGKPDNSIILIFSWKQLPENSWSKLRL